MSKTTSKSPERAADDLQRGIHAVCGDLTRAIDDRLNAVRGYCELALMKSENGENLAHRMDAAIDAVDELSQLIHALVACRGDPPARSEPEAESRNGGGAAL